MADQHLRLQAFVKLGEFFREFCAYTKSPSEQSVQSHPFFLEFQEKISLSRHKNGWFTKDNIMFAINSWGNQLTNNQLEAWLSTYNLSTNTPKTVAVIMAGNIPLVGFHDFLCVLLTGNSVLAKLSSNDNVLFPFIAEYLEKVEPSLKGKVKFSEDRLSDFDAVIATGSNNTSRYFEYYFGQKPNIIRKNRNSVAVLTGNETQEMLQALGEDIFRYYGLGCRSVSKLFVPVDYNFDPFFEAISSYKDIIDQQKYANNYDYNKAVYLMSEFKILDNGFLMLKADENYGSPIATLFYESFSSAGSLKNRIIRDKEKIQCVVAQNFLENEIPFGQTQGPGLSDYADGIDTVEFLLKT